MQGGKVKAHQNSHLRHIMLTVVNEVQMPLQSQIPSIHATSERQQVPLGPASSALQARCKHEAALPPSRQHSSAGMQSIAKHITASYMMCKPDHMTRTSRSNGAVQHRALSRFFRMKIQLYNGKSGEVAPLALSGFQTRCTEHLLSWSRATFDPPGLDVFCALRLLLSLPPFLLRVALALHFPVEVQPVAADEQVGAGVLPHEPR